MSNQELEGLAKRMVEKGISAHLRNGENAIFVSLAKSQKMPPLPREERKTLLKKEFQEKINNLQGIEVDFDSLSVSGQTVNAKIAVKYLNSLLNLLKSKSLDIYPVIKQQIV